MANLAVFVIVPSRFERSIQMKQKKQWDMVQFGPFALHQLVDTYRPLNRPSLQVLRPHCLLPKFFLHFFFLKYLLTFELNCRWFLKR